MDKAYPILTQDVEEIIIIILTLVRGQPKEAVTLLMMNWLKYITLALGIINYKAGEAFGLKCFMTS